MTESDVTPRPTQIPNIWALMRRVIVTQYDPPIAAVCPWFQVLLQKSYDVVFAITAFRGNCYREPFWEPATADELLQTFVGSSILLCFEHTLGRRHRASRKLRRCCQICCPSTFHVTVAFDDWHDSASDRQNRFVLAPCLVVVERRLIPIIDQWVVSKHQENEISNTEQHDPQYFKALLDNAPWDRVLPVRPSHGQTIFRFPPTEPM